MQKNLWYLCFIVSVSLGSESIAKEGYHIMLQNLIRFLKDGRKCWVKQRELFSSSVTAGCPQKVLAFDQQYNKSLLFNLENISNIFQFRF